MVRVSFHFSAFARAFECVSARAQASGFQVCVSALDILFFATTFCLACRVCVRVSKESFL